MQIPGVIPQLERASSMRLSQFKQYVPRDCLRLMVVMVVLMASLPNAGVALQDTSAGSSPAEPAGDELPQHAIWRFGEYGRQTDSNGFYRLTYSPNGQYLATRNQNNSMAIYDVENRKQICEMGGHEYWVTSIDFSPDSTRFLSASPGDDERVKLWNSQTGELIYELPIEASCAVFSLSGNWIYALGHQDVQQFETATGQLVKKTTWKNGDSKALTISRDGRYIIVSHRMNNDQTIITKRLDLENDSSVVLPGPSKPPNAVVISDNNQWIAASYYDDTRIRLWDLKDPNQQKFILEAHDDRVQSIAISPDSRFLVSTSWDETAVIWDLLTRQALGKLEGHTEHVNSCAFSPTAFQIATGASGKTDCSVIVWSIEEILFPEKAKKITADDFPAAWASLGSTLPKPALTAVNDLRNSAGEVLPLLSEKLGAENQSTSQDRIQELISDLGSEVFALREEATRQLIEALGQAEPSLREALETATSAEVRYRIMSILRHEIVRPPINLTSLRQLYRSIFLLELLANDSDQKEIAFSTLEAISANHRHIDIAREAAAALKRAKSAAVRLPGN